MPPASPPPAESALIDIKDLCSLLSISRAHCERLKAAGQLPPHVQLGRCVRWRRLEVMLWLECGCPDQREWRARRRA